MPIIKFQVKLKDNKEGIDITFDVAYDSSTTIRNFIKDFARKINMTEENLMKKYVFFFPIRGFNNFISYFMSNSKLGDIIKENQIVYLSRPVIRPIIIGGDLSIVDISKNKTKEFEQSENTPWYNIGGDGLNILSKCRNKECIAYNDEICINIGYVQNWDTFTNSDKIKCPCCGYKVKPLNFAFKHCSYLIQYNIKINGDYEGRTNKGTTISDKFVIFDINESGNADYYKLVFNVEKI